MGGIGRSFVSSYETYSVFRRASVCRSVETGTLHPWSSGDWPKCKEEVDSMPPWTSSRNSWGASPGVGGQ